MTRFFKHRAPASRARQCGKTGKARLVLRLLPIFLILSSAPPAAAYESLPVRNGDGNVVFRLDLFGRGETYWYDSDEGGFLHSARDFSATEVGGLRRGLEYWTDVLKPVGAPFTPVIVRAGVMPDQDYNAAAIFFSSADACSEPGCGPGDTYGRAYEALHRGKDLSLEASGVPDDPLVGAHILTYYHNYSWDTQADSQLPETKGSLTPTVVHEIGHALGIVYNNPLFSRHLYGTAYDPETGTLGTLVFQGTEATKVFGGYLPMAHSSDQEASHFGLRNGLMTHVQIVNYPMLMEAELAAVQDIGYTVDRRGFFGLSIYADAQSGGASPVVSNYDDFYANQNNFPVAIENHLGFFHSRGLDADGNWLGYDTSRPNTTPFGVGLHLYGSGWTVTQMADLLACGSGGAGVRIDGFDNTVNIPEGVSVAADGERGTGILVSFGSGHTVNSQGTLRATGPLGIAARFDMGA
ncbi:MAG: hypothetical protein LBL72_06895, partial [Candidatus Accumulibacter sp.]|nr:hypothetical protein [Accumulibacter sp.]